MRKPEKIRKENEELTQKIKRYEELIRKTEEKIKKNEELLTKTKKVNAPKQYVKILSSEIERLGFGYQCIYSFKYKEYILKTTSLIKSYTYAVNKWRKIEENSIIHALENHLRQIDYPYEEFKDTEIYQNTDMFFGLVEKYKAVARKIVESHRGGA